MVSVEKIWLGSNLTSREDLHVSINTRCSVEEVGKQKRNAKTIILLSIKFSTRERFF